MESLILKPNTSSIDLTRTIKAIYQQETPKSIQIRLVNGIKIWVPKRYIDSEYSSNTLMEQKFRIENYILKKLGFRENLKR
jgi:hypothetical protein